MPTLDVSDIPETQSEIMNHDHKEFVDILNSIITLATDENNKNENAIDAALDKLLIHTEEHFSKEEALMAQANFPPYPVHKAEHERILKILKDSISHWQLNRDRETLHPLLQELLPEWFIQHVSTMDKVTAEFLARTGNS